MQVKAAIASESTHRLVSQSRWLFLGLPAVANLPRITRTRIGRPKAKGSPGSVKRSAKVQEYPLGCWEMQQNPINGESEHGETAAIKAWPPKLCRSRVKM